MGRWRARWALKWLTTGLVVLLAALFVWSGWEQLSVHSASGLHSAELWGGDLLVRWHLQATRDLAAAPGLGGWLPRVGLCPNFVRPSYRWHYPAYFVSAAGHAHWFVLPLWMPLGGLTLISLVLWWWDRRRGKLVTRVARDDSAGRS
jgi:hypothetical protein